MKAVNSIVKKAVLFFFISSVFLAPAIAQEKEDGAATKESRFEKNIAARQYVFEAQTALPMGGRALQLTTPYDLRIKGDTVVAFLPYFGRAFSAPVNPAEGGIQFTSTDFAYKATKRKNGWDVEIRPKDVSDVRQLFLHISESGRATLQVNSTRRQPISFNGFIKTADTQS